MIWLWLRVSGHSILGPLRLPNPQRACTVSTSSSELNWILKIQGPGSNQSLHLKSPPSYFHPNYLSGLTMTDHQTSSSTIKDAVKEKTKLQCIRDYQVPKKKYSTTWTDHPVTPTPSTPQAHCSKQLPLSLPLNVAPLPPSASTCSLPPCTVGF